jgi:hypothetical protein
MDNFTSMTQHSIGHKLLALAVILILLLQAGIFYLFLNPVNLLNQLTTVQTINEITKQANVAPNELPQVGIIGDGKNLKDIEELKKGNAIDAEIYKEAKNGDYAVGYTSKLIIYRPSDKKIVYDGETPQQKLAKAQQSQVALVSTVSKAALDANLITDKTPAPQASVVTDPEKVKTSNAFYKDVTANDIIATYTNPDLVVIYRPAENKIVKSGQVSISIK